EEILGQGARVGSGRVEAGQLGELRRLQQAKLPQGLNQAGGSVNGHEWTPMRLRTARPFPVSILMAGWGPCQGFPPARTNRRGVGKQLRSPRLVLTSLTIAHQSAA